MAKETKTKAGSPEAASLSPKKFRQTPEIEGFYRFIYENDLQREALEILERIIRQRQEKKGKKA